MNNAQVIEATHPVAKLIGVSRATLQRYKNGEEPSLRAVVGIADAFGLALGEVVTKTADDQQAVAS